MLPKEYAEKERQLIKRINELAERMLLTQLEDTVDFMNCNLIKWLSSKKSNKKGGEKEVTKKRFETNYTLTFGMNAENKEEAGKIGQEALSDYMKSTIKGNVSHIRATHGFTEEIIEL